MQVFSFGVRRLIEKLSRVRCIFIVLYPVCTRTKASSAAIRCHTPSSMSKRLRPSCIPESRNKCQLNLLFPLLLLCLILDPAPFLLSEQDLYVAMHPLQVSVVGQCALSSAACDTYERRTGLISGCSTQPALSSVLTCRCGLDRPQERPSFIINCVICMCDRLQLFVL